MLWASRTRRLQQTGMRTVAKGPPSVVWQSARLAWRASRIDTAAVIGCTLVAGVFTAFGLRATTGGLTALFGSGPTPDRVRDALPSLALVAGAAALRAGLQAAAGWSRARLLPQVEPLVELRLHRATTAVRLSALEDAEFLDDLKRAEGRGMRSAPMVVQNAVDVLTGVAGLGAAAGALGVLHPLLLPLLLLTAMPEGWAAVRGARMRYATELTLIGAMRRTWILSDLMAERRHAAEIRSFTMRGFLLEEFDRVAAHQRRVHLDLARRQAVARLLGDLLKGLATGGVYATPGLMLWVGAAALRLRPHHRRGPHLHLPRRRDAVTERGVAATAARRSGGAGGRERVRQEHPGQGPGRAVRAGRRRGPLGRGADARGAAGDRRFKGGAELSGGRWQRPAVARGFLRDAPLLICDEPTAASDARAEHLLSERIRAHADGRTVLLITHRLAGVRHADRIYVLERGRVVEEGDHASLMARDGLYAELYGLQAAAYRAAQDSQDTLGADASRAREAVQAPKAPRRGPIRGRPDQR